MTPPAAPSATGTTHDIRLARPYMDDAIKARVSAVLDSGWLTEGPTTYELEKRFAQFCDVPHAVAVTSCTTGLEAVVRAYGIGPGDEVIVPGYTYPATASAATQAGATAVVVEVDPDTMLIDLDALEAAITPRTRAVIPVSLFGNPLDYDRLRAIGAEHDIRMIEDAACTIGAQYAGKPVGGQLDASVFSLHPRKTLSTGEGGMITTRDDKLAEWLRVYKNFGSRRNDSPRGFEFQLLGTNLKLSNILAAVGLGMMDVLDQLLSARQEIAARYIDRLRAMPGVRLPALTDRGRHGWQSFPLFVEERDRVNHAMRELGIETQIGSYGLHRHSAFTDSGQVRLVGDLAHTARVDDTCLVLPIYLGLTDEDIETVLAELERCLAG